LAAPVAAVGQADVVADLFRQGGVAVQFTGRFHFRGQLPEGFMRRAILRADGRRAAMVGVRQEGYLGRHAGNATSSAAALAMRASCSASGVVDVGIGDEEVRQQHGVQCRDSWAPSLADDLFHMRQVAVVVAVQAAQHGVGVAGLTISAASRLPLARTSASLPPWYWRRRRPRGHRWRGR
jgi:hypothetical protein